MAVDFETSFKTTPITRLKRNIKRKDSPITRLKGNIKRKDSRLGLIENTGGYLSGDFPDGITKVDNVPASAIIRVLVRSVDPFIDGMIVAQTVSSPEGIWRVSGLDSRLRYDVICRMKGLNDMILSDIAPMT